MDVLGKLITTQAGAENVSLIMVIIGIVLAVLALPAGKIATRFGSKITLLVSLVSVSSGLLVMGLIPHLLWLGAIVAIPAFGTILNSVIPWVLNLVPSSKAGLGIGSYFGGFSAAIAIFGLVFPDASLVTPVMGAVYGAIAFLLGAGCIKIATAKSS
jgi:MFS family permease